MIPVTKTFLPPQEEYNSILKRAWDKTWITNRGELVKELEEKLKLYLNVKNIILTTNGTLPLQIAIKALQLKGEIITTPFSYVATTSSIVWENCQPVFVDINPEYLTIDETKIEAVISNKTSAILATHVFGNPCNIEAIDAIAKKHHLKVIYDAAHCFGVKYKDESIFNYGDISTCSFHATKLFHTGEGGAIFTKDPELQHRCFYMHNFGHKGQEDFYGVGINAKVSELNAAMGLAILPKVKELIAWRKKSCLLYDEILNTLEIQFLKLLEGTEFNYAYYPVVFKNEQITLKVQNALKKEEIFPRRYFFPSLNKLNYLNYQPAPVSEDICTRVLCLPLYAGLETSSVEKIAGIIKQIMR